MSQVVKLVRSEDDGYRIQATVTIILPRVGLKDDEIRAAWFAAKDGVDSFIETLRTSDILENCMVRTSMERIGVRS